MHEHVDQSGDAWELARHGVVTHPGARWEKQQMVTCRHGSLQIFKTSSRAPEELGETKVKYKQIIIGILTESAFVRGQYYHGTSGT